MKKLLYLSGLAWLLIHLVMPVHAQGQLWGMTRVGGSGAGVIFKTNADGSDYVSVQKAWNQSVTGIQSLTGVTLGANGKFYGATYLGGTYNKGTLYEYNPATQVYVTLHDFEQSKGNSPVGGVLYATNGKLYGLLAQNQDYKGSIYEYDLVTNTYTERSVLSQNLVGTRGGLMQASNGKIYGTIDTGIFEFDLTTFVVTQKVALNQQTGYNSSGRLMQASNGKLYGAQGSGGANNGGTLFEYDILTSTYVVKFDFLERDGGKPSGYLVESSANGKLYGISSGSGYMRPGVNSPDYGTIYEFDPASGVVTVKKDFALDFALGSGPAGTALTQASNGNLYGFSFISPTQTAIFEFDPITGISSRKLTFGTYEGIGKYSWMTLGPNNLLYGTTMDGGITGNGTLIRYAPASNNFSKEFDFGQTKQEGGFPYGGLTLASNKIYGMVSTGGAAKVGCVFEINPVDGTYTTAYEFDVTNGATPLGGLTLASNGKLYGMTTFGGTTSTDNHLYLKASGFSNYVSGSGFGVLFEFDPVSHSYTKKYNFAMSTGSNPYGNLMQASNGKLYGITSEGGANGGGVFFEYDLSGGYTVKYHFSNTMSDPYTRKGPKGSLVEVNGKLYGMTPYGGVNNGGTIFEYDLVSGQFTTKASFSSPTESSTTSTGAVPNGTLTLAANGKLYGVTSEAGISGVSYYGGSIFEYDIAQSTITKKVDLTFETVYSSMSSLTASPNGKLYGTSLFALNSSSGAVFEFDPITNKLNRKFDFNYQNGSSPYYGALLLVSGKMEQTISLAELGYKQLDVNPVTFDLPLTSSGGLTISYSSSDPTIASVTGNKVTLIKTGTVSITAQQAGDANYNPAPQVIRSLVVDKGDQTIQFNSLVDRKLSEGAFSLYAYTSSGLTAQYRSSDSEVATITNGYILTPNKVGTVTITVSQPGNDTFKPAAEVSRTLTITKGEQTISFPSFGTTTFTTTPFSINATASSGLALTYTSSNPDVATINGNQITMVSTGTTEITASQSGDVNYFVAANVTRSLVISKKEQSINFLPIANHTLGDSPFQLSASASSNLIVNYSTLSDKVTIAGNVVTMIKAGSVTISADQPGNDNFSAASKIDQTFCVNPATPVITLSGQNTESVLLTSSASQGNQWYLNGNVIVSATQTTYHPATLGNYQVKSVIDNCTSELSKELALVVTGITNENSDEVKIFPNPTTDRIQIELPIQNTSHTIRVQRMDGSLINQLVTLESKTEIDISTFSNGIYLITIQNNKMVYHQKFIKQ